MKAAAACRSPSARGPSRNTGQPVFSRRSVTLSVRTPIVMTGTAASLSTGIAASSASVHRNPTTTFTFAATNCRAAAMPPSGVQASSAISRRMSPSIVSAAAVAPEWICPPSMADGPLSGATMPITRSAELAGCGAKVAAAIRPTAASRHLSASFRDFMLLVPFAMSRQEVKCGGAGCNSGMHACSSLPPWEPLGAVPIPEIPRADLLRKECKSRWHEPLRRHARFRVGGSSAPPLSSSLGSSPSMNSGGGDPGMARRFDTFHHHDAPFPVWLLR